MEPRIWIVIGILLAIIEIFTPGFFVGTLAFACFIVSIFALFFDSIQLQLYIFSISLVLVFLGIRPVLLKYLTRKRNEFKSNVDRLIGMEVFVCEEIEAEDSSKGRVKVEGDVWKARSKNKTENIGIGEKVIIKYVDGTILYVEKSKED